MWKPMGLGGAMVGAVVAVVFVIPSSRHWVLGELRREPSYDGRHLSLWVEDLHSPDALKRAEVTEDGKAAVPDLRAALKDEEPRVRFNAALALSKIGPAAEAATMDLAEALEDEDALVRMDAAMALTHIGPGARDAVPALVEALNRDKNQIRVIGFSHTISHQIAMALGHIGPDAHAAVPALTEMLQESEWMSRSFAARALGQIGSEAKSALPDLRDLLEDNSEEVRRDVDSAIKLIDPTASARAGNK
jgi:HEAT repeat protein